MEFINIAQGPLERRARRKKACDACHRRKIQCDWTAPCCDWCRHQGLACTFSRSKRSLRSAHSGSPVARSSTCSASPMSSTKGPNSTSMSQMSPLATLHFAGHDIGGINSGSGMPLFSPRGLQWIQEQTGETTHRLNLATPLWENQTVHEDLLLAGPTSMLGKLPPRQSTDLYLSTYSSDVIRFIFPFVDPLLFRHTVDLAYTPERLNVTPTVEHITARACVLSFLAFMVLILGQIDSAPIDKYRTLIAAQYMLPQALLTCNTTTLQICQLQAICHLVTGKTQTAALFHAMSCRILVTLGAHLNTDTPHDTIEGSPSAEELRDRRQLRNLFWMAYTLDREMPLRTGHPPIINEDDCDLSLPASYFDPGTESVRIQGARFPGDLRLSLLKSKVFRLLYSAKAKQKSDAHLLRDIRELDDELEAWRMSVDSHSRPRLSYGVGGGGSGAFSLPADSTSSSASSSPAADGSGSGTHEAVHRAIHRTMIMFEYHYLMATIHGATGRCRAWSSSPEDGSGGGTNSEMMRGVRLSMDLAVEASRSTLIFLACSDQQLLSNPYWIVLFYPMSAVITIFCDILCNPGNPRARADLELLGRCPGIIKNMRAHRLEVGEAKHAEAVEDFVVELGFSSDVFEYDF
ncbi:fungal-specific transcription factor domain-domain-containing protein [Microdochium bolleyi]|uniref:Fungal-specific transcription factor domain-domain-containing protein n=1 Tax=Microdochium bolleyi TaxID=196109 RepID=A0A136IUR3_9PEZI|nr:fungal-specific transcription factor domain-domain-containing protein [Microdochium bolleyi]